MQNGSDDAPRLVLFGASNMIGDIFDCACGRGLRIAAIVMNQDEVLRERTRSVHERARWLSPPPPILEIAEFRPHAGDLYFLGTTAPARTRLVQLLKERHGLAFATLIHPTAYVSPLATLGEGVFVGAQSAVGPGAVIGDHVFINRGVTVGHDSIVKAYARLQPGCNVGGHTTIGAGATIGLGAGVIEERVVGDGAFVAAGAIVLEDVAENALVAGIPARFKKRVGD